MSADSSWDVQAGVYDRLTGDGVLMALLSGGVLDHVPAGTVFPYIVMGEQSVAPMDSQGSSGSEVVLTLHIYSRGNGMKELKQIMAAVYGLLHEAAFTVPNQTLVLCRFQGGETVLESDGITRHGRQRFQVITEPV